MSMKETEENKMTPRISAIKALNIVYEKLESSGLTEEAWGQAKRECECLKEMYGFTPFQCFMVAAMMTNGGLTDLESLAQSGDCSLLHVFGYKSEADDLVKRRLATKSYYGLVANHNYCLESGLVNAILDNRGFAPIAPAKMSRKVVMAWVKQLIDEYRNCDDTEHREAIVDSLRQLYAESTHLPVSAWIDGLDLNANDLLMLSMVATEYVLDNCKVFGQNDWKDIWADDEDNEELTALQNGTSKLTELGYLTPQHDCRSQIYVLTVKAMGEIFPSQKSELEAKQKAEQVKQAEQAEEDETLMLDEQMEDSRFKIISAESISEKQLFYNPSEAEQLERLGDLLSQEKFVGIQQRLKKSGLRQGFACLFYGDPGTGKTETVLQLARKTGRTIMKVDMSKVREKYNGDSEKSVQAVFDQYSERVHSQEVAPILLLNEADALLGNRMETTRDWSDKMENAILDITLDAMENLEGIMIATTNLASSLDPAMERRFLYKVKFAKPNQEVKEKIWHSMVPDLGDNETRELAKSYDFSGGQIENIKRKQVVDNLLYGTAVSYDHILQLCKEEKLAKNNSLAIGFR